MDDFTSVEALAKTLLAIDADDQRYNRHAVCFLVSRLTLSSSGYTQGIDARVRAQFSQGSIETFEQCWSRIYSCGKSISGRAIIRHFLVIVEV